MTLPLIIITLLATLIVCVVVSWLASAPTAGQGQATLEEAHHDGWIHWRDALDRTACSAHWVAPGEISDADFEGDEEVTEPLPRVDAEDEEPAEKSSPALAGSR